MKQIGGTTGVFRRNRYDNTAQRRAAGQKTSWHRARLNHMESRFFSFHSFIFFNLEALHLFSVPSALFSSPATFSAETLTRQKVVFNLPYVSSLQPLLLRALNSPGHLCFLFFFRGERCLRKQIKYVLLYRKLLSGTDYVAQSRQHSDSASLTVVWEISVSHLLEFRLCSQNYSAGKWVNPFTTTLHHFLILRWQFASNFSSFPERIWECQDFHEIIRFNGHLN